MVMEIQVEFKKSEKIALWCDSHDNLLEMAEENGIKITSECAAGICGSCKVKLLDGEVEMETQEGLDDEDLKENMILLCVSVPLSNLVLDV